MWRYSPTGGRGRPSAVWLPIRRCGRRRPAARLRDPAVGGRLRGQGDPAIRLRRCGGRPRWLGRRRGRPGTRHRVGDPGAGRGIGPCGRRRRLGGRDPSRPARRRSVGRIRVRRGAAHGGAGSCPAAAPRPWGRGSPGRRRIRAARTATGPRTRGRVRADPTVPSPTPVTRPRWRGPSPWAAAPDRRPPPAPSRPVAPARHDPWRGTR